MCSLLPWNETLSPHLRSRGCSSPSFKPQTQLLLFQLMTVSTCVRHWWSLAPVWYNWLIIPLTMILQNPWLCASVPIGIDAGSNTKYWFKKKNYYISGTILCLPPFFSHLPKTVHNTSLVWKFCVNVFCIQGKNINFALLHRRSIPVSVVWLICLEAGWVTWWGTISL